MADASESELKSIESGFLFLGIGSLLPWNAIISNLDFLIYYQKEFHPEITFPNMNFILNLGIQFLLLSTKKIFKYKTQIYTSLLIFLINLILLPITTIYIKGILGFRINCIIMLLNGVSNALISSSIFGLVSFFPIKCLISLSMGQGLAGILMNVLRYIILIFFGDNEKNINFSSYIFFTVSAFIMLITIFKFHSIYKKKYFQNKLKLAGEDINQDFENESIDEPLKIPDKENKKEEFSILYVIFKIIGINLMIIYCFVITFTLFPGASIKPNLFNLSMGWKINTIIFIFNLFDTIGRKLLSYINPSKCILYSFSFLRTILLFTFPLVCYCENHKILDNNMISILSIINVILLSISNGFLSSLCFALGPEQVEGEMKGKAGSSVSLCLSFGIFLGTFGAMIMQKYTSI